MSTGRSWSLFIVGLLLSTFLGGGIHVLFSPERVKDYVLRLVNEKNPKFNLEFSRAQLSLARGWIPQVAIELEGVRIQAKDKCVTEDEINMDRFAVPVALRSLFQTKLRFGIIRASEVKYYKRNKTCVTKGLSDSVAPTTSQVILEAEESASDEIAPLERFFRRRWTKEVVNTTKYIDEIVVDRLRYFAPDGNELFELHEMSVTFDKKAGESTAEFDFYPAKIWSGGEPFGPTRTLLRVQAENVFLAGSGSLKEGQFLVQGHWAVEKGQYEYTLRGSDLPMHNVLGFARHWGSFPTLNAQLRNQWMSCQWSGSGQVRNINKEIELKVRNCTMYGDLGKMTMKDADLLINKDSGPFPVEVQLEKVPVQAGLSAFGIGRSWGLVSHFGYYEGRLLLTSAHQLELIGQLRESEYFLSSPAGNTKQKVQEFHLKLAYDEMRFSGLVDQIVLDEGEMEGQISFNISAVGEGVVQVALPVVRLPEAAQKILFGGRVESLEVFGLGNVDSDGLRDFDGKFGILSFETQQWRMEKLKVQTRLENKIWRLGLVAESFYPKPESKWRVFGYTLLSAAEQKPKELKFNSVNGKIRLSGKKGDWEEVKAGVESTKVRISSSGVWMEKGELNGQLRAYYNDKNQVDWRIEGSLASPVAIK